MKAKLSVKQFILMPVRGFRAIEPFSTSRVTRFLTSISHVGMVGPQVFGKKGTPPLQLRVLDSIHEDGPKLVELRPEWLHILIVMAFGVFIMYSKHLHLLAGPVNLLFKNMGVKAEIPLLNLEEQKKFGSPQVTDLTRKDLLDLRSDDPVQRYVSRWRLQKKDPTAEVSDPVLPITYWIENSTPKEWREAVKK